MRLPCPPPIVSLTPHHITSTLWAMVSDPDFSRYAYGAGTGKAPQASDCDAEQAHRGAEGWL